MSKRLLVIFLFIPLMTSACGAQAPAETVTPTMTVTEIVTATANETETPIATETPSAQASITSTPETPIPTNPPDCTNRASFVADVTIPDNSNVASGTTFTKTWRVRNTGTCIWGPDYVLAHYSEEPMGAVVSVPLAVTFPNQTLDVSVDLIASSAVGTHRGNFVIKNPAGLIMSIDNDSRLWVIVNVSEAVASDATAAIPVTGSSTGTVSGAGNGFAKVTCAYTADATKVTETISAVNAYRAQNSLPAYTVNEQLTQAATAHANDMACNSLFVHTGSDGSTPDSRVAASGYVASSVSENVYGSYPPLTGQGAVNWWKNDKTDINHNKNLLSNTFTEIGVGYSFYNNYGYYVLVFAAP
jgi:uncharacterized protein YkwD